MFLCDILRLHMWTRWEMKNATRTMRGKDVGISVDIRECLRCGRHQVKPIRQE